MGAGTQHCKLFMHTQAACMYSKREGGGERERGRDTHTHTHTEGWAEGGREGAQ